MVPEIALLAGCADFMPADGACRICGPAYSACSAMEPLLPSPASSNAYDQRWLKILEGILLHNSMTYQRLYLLIASCSGRMERVGSSSEQATASSKARPL
jgi:hypothetical protein